MLSKSMYLKELPTLSNRSYHYLAHGVGCVCVCVCVGGGTKDSPFEIF